MIRPPEPAFFPENGRRDLPRHVGVIMDGNGRWASRRNVPRIVGHRAGVRTIRPVVESFDKAGVRIVTLYAFSSENWTRPRAEVSALMRLFSETIDTEVAELHANGVQIRVIGDRDLLSNTLRNKVQKAEALTAFNQRAILNVAISYGGRAEIIAAVRDLAAREIEMTALDEATLSSALYTRGLPDPDMIIRTAGEFRISNFLLWQAAYSEIFVTDTLWPDFGPQDVDEALQWYATRVRKFGGVVPQK